MTANPIELISGLTSTANVPKADLIAWAKSRVSQVLADPTEVNNTDLVNQKSIFVLSLSAIFKLDVSDTTSADNGTSILVSNDGYRFKIVSSLPTPTSVSIGGVFASDAPTHKFAIGVDTDGNVLYEQPAASDLTNGTTGSGEVVLKNAPALVDPTANTWNGLTITSTTGTLTIAAGKTLTVSNSVEIAGTDGTKLTFQGTGTVVNRDSTDTLSNKSIDASNNTITNLTTSMFATNVVDTDGTLAANSDTRLPSQKAVKTAIDALIGANDVEVYKGLIDCSTNPNYPAADAGHVYRVSVAGKIGGASGINVEIGDRVQCITDSTASGNQATVGANWWITQTNIDGAVTGPASSTSGNIATFNGTSGKVIQDGGKALPTGTIVGTSDTQAITGKTYEGLTITSTTGTLTIAAGKTLTVSNTITFTAAADGQSFAFPAVGGTIVTTGGTQTLTGKTYDTAGSGNSFSINGVAATDNTGTGKVVRDNAPTLVNPDVGTQSPGDNTTKAASTAFVQAAVSASVSGVSSLNGQTGALTFVTPPQGRLTLVTAVPVMTTSQSAKTTLYYTPYVGAQIPIYDGSNFVPTPFSELSIATTDTTYNPAALGASKVNDWFVWNDGGTIRLSHGPDWTDDVTRSAGSALVKVNGVWLNNASITNGPAASRGTWVGTTRTNSSSQLDFIFGGTAAGGTAAWFGVWNAYNRRQVSAYVSDSSSNFSYGSTTTVAFNNSGTGSGLNNRVSFVSGAAEDGIDGSFECLVAPGGSAGAYGMIGVALDSTSSPARTGVVLTGDAASLQSSVIARKTFNPVLGFHYLQATMSAMATACQFIPGSGLFTSLDMNWQN